MALEFKTPFPLDVYVEIFSELGVWAKSPSSAMSALLDLLEEEAKVLNDGTGFWHNRNRLLSAYASGRVYVMECKTDLPDTMRLHPRLPNDRIPAFLAFDPNKPKDMMLWVHETFRGRGCARHLIEWAQREFHTAMDHVWSIENAIAFWEHMNYEHTGRFEQGVGYEMKRVRGLKRAADDAPDDEPQAKQARRDEEEEDDDKPPRRWYLSIDIEGRGSSLANPITAIGVFFAPTDDPALGEKKRWALQPLPGQTDEERCVKEFWSRHPDVDAWIRANARPAAAVMAELQDWCRAAVVKAGGPGRITLLSDCPDYDLGRLDHLGHATATWDNTMRYLGGHIRHMQADPSERFEQLVPAAANQFRGWLWRKGGQTRRLIDQTHFPDDDAEQTYYQQLFCDECLRK